MKREFDVLTFGDACVDLILRDEDIVPRFGQVEQLVADYQLEMGGSCLIFAAQAAKLGLKVALLGAVGDDGFGALIRDRLGRAGVDLRYLRVDPELRTGLTVHLESGGDRAMLTHLGSINALTESDVTDELLASARHLHYGSLYLQTGLLPRWITILERAKALRLSVSLDTNWDPREIWDVGLGRAFRFVDLLLPNESEAMRLSGQADFAAAVAHLRELVPLLAVKRGAAGAVAWRGDECWAQAVAPAGGGGDAIGAGDSFAAGFLAGWLNDLPLETCLSIACECGRAAASHSGGAAGQAWRADFAELIALDER